MAVWAIYPEAVIIVQKSRFEEHPNKHRTYGRDSIILPLRTRAPQVVKQQQQPVCDISLMPMSQESMVVVDFGDIV